MRDTEQYRIESMTTVRLLPHTLQQSSDADEFCGPSHFSDSTELYVWIRFTSRSRRTILRSSSVNSICNHLRPRLPAKIPTAILATPISFKQNRDHGNNSFKTTWGIEPILK